MNSTPRHKPEDLTAFLVKHSKDRANDLQELAFKSAQRLYGQETQPLFVVTRESNSGLFFAPSSNFPLEEIRKLSKNATEGVRDSASDLHDRDYVGAFRDFFDDTFEKEKGLLKHLTTFLTIQALRSSTVALAFTASGKIFKQALFDSSYRVVENEIELLNHYLGTQGVVSDSTMEPNVLRVAELLSGDSPGSCSVLVLRAQPALESRKRRPSIRLTQICLATRLSESDLRSENPWNFQEIWNAMDASSAATYSVLYERERYFEKAIRQSIAGTIIKWDSADARNILKDQVEALKACNPEGQMIHAAPFVLNDQTIHNPGGDPESEVALPWYEMVRYEMQSLDTILTRTPGFKEYEIKALARSVFNHLDRHFWDTVANHGNHGISPRTATILPLQFLRQELRTIRTKMKKKLTAWSHAEPVQISKTKLAFPELSQDVVGLPFAAMTGDFSSGSKWLEIDLSGGGNGLERVQASKRTSAFDPIERLDRLIEKLQQQHDEPESCVRKLDNAWKFPSLRGDRTHGDPHFENLFADVSIPEDALIVAIDPFSPDYGATAKILKKEHINSPFGASVHPDSIEKAVSEYSEHICQDVAKLLLSSSSLYALAKKGAMQGGSYEHENSNGNFRLEWRQGSRTLPIEGESLGVSGAMVYKRSVPSVDASKDYHRWFTRDTVRLYEAWIIEQHKKSQESSDDRNFVVNLYLILLWSMLLRHTCSIGEKLIPESPDIAEQIFCIALFHMEKGFEVFEREGFLGMRETSGLTESLRQLFDSELIPRV